MTQRTLSVLVLALSLAACHGQDGYDPDTSRAYRAAWEKRRVGDEAGYRAALLDVAKHRGTWAGDRAALDLENADDTSSDTLIGQLLRQAAQIAGDPSKLPAGLRQLQGSTPAPTAPSPSPSP